MVLIFQMGQFVSVRIHKGTLAESCSILKINWIDI